MRTFDSIEIEVSERDITLAGAKAQVIQKIRLVAISGRERRERLVEEILSLRKEAGEWKITGGL